MKLLYVLRVTIFLLLAFPVFNAQAQTVSLSGRILDETGGPLPGASIVVTGGKSVSSDPNGNYRITGIAKGTVEIIVRYIGYQDVRKSVVLSGDLVQNFNLQPASSNLNEVVVVGYGTTRKQDLTGSITVVGAKDFQKGSITTPEQMLAGKAAGVSITSNGGQPGAGSTIRIRGGASLSASNDPLFVIDGIPLDNSGVSGATNPLSFINPNDIESFTVLKDASAAAIYGARAANGVIIITTKKGVSGDLKIGFTTVNSISKIIAKTDVLDGDQIREIVNGTGQAAKIAQLGTFNTKWQDLIYQDGLATDNNLSISGGVKGLPYRLSLGYQNQRGILRTDELEKTSAAFVLNPTFFDNHLKVDINLKGSMQKTRFANTAAIGGATSFDPTQAVYTNRPDYLGYYEWLDNSTPSGLVNLVGRNPVGILEQTENRANPLRSIGNIQLDYKFHFLPDLHANVNAGYDIANGKGTSYVNPLAALNINDQGYDNKYRQTKTNTVFDFYLNYVKALPSIKSRIDATAGYSYNNYLTTAYNYPSYNGYGVKVANSDPAFPFNKPENRLISYFGRLNYNYDERFLLTATIRRDGSSKFSAENRNAIFPSVALAWTLKNESFLKDNKTISSLKLRVGYGITGQQDGGSIGNYGYLSTYGFSAPTTSYQFGNEFYQMYRPSAYISDLKWEQTATTNAGIDAGFLDNRISGSLDLYLKKTSDLLNLVPQPAGTNFSASAVVNVGSMENKGVEMNINFVPVKSADLNWDFSLNATYNKNTITNLTVVPNDANYIGLRNAGAIAGGVGGQYALISSVGYSKNLFYLYEQVYDQSGNPIEGVYVDQNGDGQITPNDLHRGKPADPKLFLGFSNNLNYKNWNMSFTMRANLGNYVYNNVSSQTGNLAQITGTAILLNANPSYLTTNFKAQQLFSDYYVENASFLKMDNINVGYRFGKVFKTNAALQLNASVQNVFTITKYTGLDPEVATGVDNNIYPRPRVFSLGLNLNF